MSKHDDKLYEDGFRDGRHGAERSPPHVEWFPFMRNSFWDENEEYNKGWRAANSTKKK